MRGVSAGHVPARGDTAGARGAAAALGRNNKGALGGRERRAARPGGVPQNRPPTSAAPASGQTQRGAGGHGRTRGG